MRRPLALVSRPRRALFALGTLVAFVASVALIGVVALAAPASASSVLVLSLPELFARAGVVVHARVVDQRVVDEPERTVTYTTLLVEDGLKGAHTGDRLVVYQPGVLDGVRVRWVAGAHHFSVGEDVVFFAAHHAHAGNDVVVALTLGYGTFDVDARGVVSEDGGGAVDAMSSAQTPARTFANIAALREALGPPLGAALGAAP